MQIVGFIFNKHSEYTNTNFILIYTQYYTGVLKA